MASTMPTSASRSSSVATSTTRPPAKRRSNGSFPCAAATARSRVDPSIASCMFGSAESVLFGLDVRGFHDPREFVDLLRQEGGELGRAVANETQAGLGKLGAHPAILQRANDRAMQALDDGRLGLGR